MASLISRIFIRRIWHLAMRQVAELHRAYSLSFS